ncbi:MAG: futalosine hydrolase [Chitinophagaceae bacterium]|nr:futalosine hydrolase [Chitinophagaceae bacterium]
MYILLAAATPLEIAPFSHLLESSGPSWQGQEVEILITGVGSLIASWSLAKAIHHRRPDFMIQAGIAGSMNPNILPPQVVIVQNERMGDLGAEDKEGFSDVFDLALTDGAAFPFTGGSLPNPLVREGADYLGLPTAQGVTVNEITTRKERIISLKNKYLVSVESMEGAAFHYAALSEHIPFLQVRAISNTVGERNKQHWKIKEAIQALNDSLITLLPQLQNI